MRLPKTGCEYARWTIADAPDDGIFELKFIYEDNTTTGWMDCERVGNTLKKLVRGPLADEVVDSIPLPLGDTATFVRLLDHPEQVDRFGGYIKVA